MLRSRLGYSLFQAAICIGAAATCSNAQVVFSYPNFTSTAGLVMNGAAVQTSPTISITPPVRASAGSFWYDTRVPVGGQWFSTFRFSITDMLGSGADGFAFVIQDSADQTAALGSPGGAIGYGGNPVFQGRPGIDRCLAVEFDLWNNQGDWEDFSASQHVSVQCHGTQSNSPDGLFSMAHTAALPNLSDGADHIGQIQYLGGVLNVFVDFNQVLSANVDLSTMLALNSGQAFVGFTASTGAYQNAERHQIHAWDFNVVPSPSAAITLAATGAGLLGLRRSRPRS